MLRNLMLSLLMAEVVSSSSKGESSVKVNPIRRVVTMLQSMQNKVTEEGKRDKEIYDKFMCYCQTGAGELSKSIGAAETKIPQVEASIKEAEELKAQLEADLKQHKQDRADAKTALAEAKALRTKEAAAYAKESSDYKTNLAALGKAITVIEKGATGFLQTSAANFLRHLTIEMDLSNSDRERLSSFLSEDHSQGYIPQSGEITGILKEMKDTMEKSLAAATKAENESIANFESLVAAKEKEIEANTKAIEDKMVRSTETAVEIVNMKEDLDDTSKALLEDKKFLEDLDANCEKKKEEYAAVVKTRADELVALAETIKILNDDDALELFKKTLPTPSLLQMKSASKQMKLQALNALKGSKAVKDARLDFIALALKGQSVDFAKVIKMIDDMVALLAEEQTADDEKKKYCEVQLDKTEDTLKELDITIADLGKAIDNTKSNIATLSDEISALEKGVKDLDKQVVEATETRKSEHDFYVTTMAQDKAAKDLLSIAKNRLNKFYNPKMYKEAPKRVLSEEESIVTSMGGTLAPTNAPGGIAGTGVAVLAQVSAHRNDVAPPPPPEAVPAYQSKSQESVGVITMIDMLGADLDKEMQEMTVEEKDSQAEYETFVADAAAKRAADLKSIAEKESAKADAEASVQKLGEEKTAKTNEAMATSKYFSELHTECDWLLSNFETRKEARAGEVDSLKNAKAVLSGADFS
jgi:hypothetical protein